MNNSNGSAIQLPLRTVILVTVQVILLLFTIVLAVAYTVLITIHRTFRRNKHNWFTVNICVTTALLCINLLIMSISTLLRTPSSLSCRFQGFSLILGASELIYAHSIAALSRLLTVVYANKHLFWSSRFTRRCIGFGWLVALLISLPHLFIVNNFICSKDQGSAVVSYYTLLVILIIPFVTIGICNTRILLHVHRSTRQVHAGEGTNRASHARDVHILKVMVVTFLVFFIGWAPVFVVLIFNIDDRIPDGVNAFFQMLPSLAMFHDVILLICANQPVRLFIKQLFVKRRQDRNHNALAVVIPLRAKNIAHR